MRLDYISPNTSTTTLSTGKVLGINLPAPIVDIVNDKLTAVAANNLVRSTYLEVSREQSRALLAQTALENTMMLSALEAICYRTAPLGDLRYSQIVNAYAASAARRIERW
jgi:hypothetical protein